MWMILVAAALSLYFVWKSNESRTQENISVNKDTRNTFIDITINNDVKYQKDINSYILLLEGSLNSKDCVILKNFTLEELKEFIGEKDPKYHLSRSFTNNVIGYNEINIDEDMILGGIRNKKDFINIENGKQYIIFTKNVTKFYTDMYEKLFNSYITLLKRNYDIKEDLQYESKIIYYKSAKEVPFMTSLLTYYVVEVLNQNIREFNQVALKDESLKIKHKNYKKLQSLLEKDYFKTSINKPKTREKGSDHNLDFLYSVWRNFQFEADDEYFISYFREKLLQDQIINLLDRVYVVCKYVQTDFFNTSFIDNILINIYKRTY